MMPKPEDDWNGGGKELDGGHEGETSYCVTCGTVMVYKRDRACPSCLNREKIEDLMERVSGLEDSLDDTAEHIVGTHTSIDDTLAELEKAVERLEERADKMERDIDVIDR